MSKKKRKTVLGKTAKKNRSTTNYTRNYPKSYMRKSKGTSKATEILWAISLVVLGISGIFFGVARIIGWMIPEVYLWTIAGVNIVALTVLVATTIIKLKNAER